MAAADRDWVRAYALQAISDLDAREALAEASVAKCHRLHFLQMAAEKTCKAYIAAGNGHESVRKSHAYVKSVLPRIAREFYGRIRSDGPIPEWQMSAIRRFSHEIEVIAPACDAGEVREDNSEYPWLDGQGNVQVPCEYAFPRLDDQDRTLVMLIRLMRTAAESLAAG